MNYLLSVIIPTKNRQYYCLAVVHQILGLKEPNMQIVIQDNSDEPILENEIAAFNTTNVKYHYHPGVLSFVDNFSEAVSISDGKYLCMIGDDDGILPNVMNAIELMVKEGYDCLIPGLNSVYCWPSESPFVKNGANGYLCLAYINNCSRVVNIQKGLQDLLKKGGQGYQECDIPRLYHGIVKRDVVDEIRRRSDKYFDGLTPDIYIAVALCFTCKKVCRVYYPITVSGMCPKSGSADSATGKHTGELKDAPHFRGHKQYSWDSKAPEIYSVESIWGETVLHALKNFGAKELYDQFNVRALDSICYLKYPQFRERIIKHANAYNIPKLFLQFACIKMQCIFIIKKIWFRVFRKRGSVKKYWNVEDISCAVDLTMKTVNQLAEM